MIVAFSITGALILATLAFFPSTYSRWILSTKDESIRGIILISLDTLRADHLGCYGYHRNTSPFIDAFAKESIVFERAVAQSPWTLPSHMSIMTSLYPAFHGVYKVMEQKQCLANEHITLAELLRKGGYQTAAFVDGGWMRKTFGFSQGFDIYDDRKVRIAGILPKVKKWLSKNKSKPFFLFIHCYDIHGPYNPPPPYDKIFHDFNYTGNLFPSNKNLIAASRKELEVNDEDLHHFIALYDGGIRYTDEKIGEFLSFLKDSGLMNQSLIIITSDHGEEFKEHDSFRHWQLYYRPNLHIPLIMRIPKYPRKEIRTNELVQSIDLLPTILEIAGLPPHPKAQGKSLLPIIKQHKNFLNNFLRQTFQRNSKISLAEYSDYNRSIIKDNFQIIYNLKSHAVQLFDLKNDPLAKNNIADEHHAVTEQLLSQLEEVYSTTPHYNAPLINLDEQTREQLKGLGYIQ